MPSSDVIEFECPRCLNKIRVEQSKAGTRIACPSCEGNLLVPSASLAQDLFEDIFDSDEDNSRQAASSADSSSNDEPVEQSKPLEVEAPAMSIEDDLTAGLEVVGDTAPIPFDDGEDPFEVDHNAPIRVDGLETLYDQDDVYGVKCKICDTHIHVRTDQVDSYVKCPECFSKVKVTAPVKSPKPSQKWVKQGFGKDIKRVDGESNSDAENDNDELKLSPPVEVPETGYAVTEPLEEVTDNIDLVPEEDLIERKPHDPADGLVLEAPEDPFAVREDEASADLVDDNAAPTALPRSPKLSRKKKKKSQGAAGDQEGNSKPKVKRPMSRREKYEAAQRKIKEGHKESAIEVDFGDTNREGSHFPEFRFEKLTDLLTEAFVMVFSSSVIWRTMIAIAFLMFGSIATQAITYKPPVEAGVQVEATGKPDGAFWEGLMTSAQAGIVGGIPYIIGLLALWHTCSYVFREAALGQRKVESWYEGGVNEILGTTLLFAFSFFLAGLPALIYPPLVTPLRMFLAPLLLLGAWYNRSPFNIVSVDAFMSFRKQAGQWTVLYIIMTALAFFALIAGFMFEARDHAISNPIIGGFFAVCSILVLVVISLIFAAITGWHCGKVMEGLEKAE